MRAMLFSQQVSRTYVIHDDMGRLGAASVHYYLFTSNYMSHCISEPDLEPFFQPFATALFSFLYHLASYDNGKCL